MFLVRTAVLSYFEKKRQSGHGTNLVTAVGFFLRYFQLVVFFPRDEILNKLPAWLRCFLFHIRYLVPYNTYVLVPGIVYKKLKNAPQL